MLWIEVHATPVPRSALMFRRFALLTAGIIVAGSCLAERVIAAAASADAATISFVEAAPLSAAGDVVTAIGLRGLPADRPAAAAVVILVDTSASQTGVYQSQSIEAVRQILAAGRSGDVFSLAAVDVSCNPLGESFQGSESPATLAALGRLRARTPLGSTDFVAGLSTAADLLEGRPEARFVVYVGDGPGVEGVDSADFSRCVNRLADSRIAVSCIGIGSHVNWALLAATAARTGGLFADATADATAVGEALAAAHIHRITWPGAATCTLASGTTVRLLPSRLPPLRSDRETIVFADGNAGGGSLAVKLGADATTAGAEPDVLPIPDVTPRDGNAYLAELVRNALPTHGVFLPLPGRESLALAKAVVRREAADLALLAQQAESAGARDSAIRLAEASLRRDPDNTEAAVVRQVTQREPLPLMEELLAPPEALPAVDDGPSGDPNAELAELQAMRRVRAQAREREIAVRIREARQLLSTAPDRARDLLKDALDQVIRDTDLDAAARDRLAAQIEMRIREANVRAREKIECDLAAERKAAVGRERQRLNGELEAREAKIKQLVNRYNALVEEGIRVGYSQSERYPQIIQGEAVTGYEEPTTAFLEAERIVGDEIRRETGELYANYPIPMPARELGRTAPLVAKIREYDAENYRTRRDGERGFMDVMHLVDVAAIPFPDDPPIIYPNAEKWRRLSDKRRTYKSAAYDPLSKVEKKIEDALEQETGSGFRFEQNSLNDLKAAIEAQYDIPVVFDMKALEGIDLAEPIITENLPGLPLRSALRQILGANDLTYVVKNDVLKITTKEAAATDLIVKAYPVGDLVMPLFVIQSVNPQNLGGNNNQPQNNGLQPQNPGGGFGGFGGGIQGGGFPGICWVAREVYGVHDVRWLVFRNWISTSAPRWLTNAYCLHGESFAAWIRTRPLVRPMVRGVMNQVVEPALDDVHVAGGQFQVTAALSRVPVEGAVGDVMPTGADTAVGPEVGDGGATLGLPAAILESEELASDLATYLKPQAASDEPSRSDSTERAARMAQLRISAADLGREGRFHRAAELLSAAIAVGYGEPWMYESLALAMEASGRTRSEIDRVLLSAADFGSNAGDLLRLAYYLARFGSDRQAVDVCRKVLRLDPTSREAYALAMTVAARNNDVETLSWACPGILAQDWPAAEASLVERATRLAKVTGESLAASGKQAEAEEFRARVEASLIRDIIIDVTWNGDADVDLMVEEPAGSVCSRSWPRSSCGGILLDEADLSGAQDAGLHRERYVASFAYAGDYKVLMRRVTGRVAADSITVEATVNKGTDRERSFKQQLPVTADDQGFVISIPEGRRQEPVHEARLKTDIAVQRAVSKFVLAQQLAAITDSTAGSQAGGGAPESPGATGVAVRRGGPVGYQPVITTLPEGTNLDCTAVVSADRRYVRIRCAPTFSAIGQIYSFTFVGGAGNQGGGGGGGNQGGNQNNGGGGGQNNIGGNNQQGGNFNNQQGGNFNNQGGNNQQGGNLNNQGGNCWVAREVYGDANPRWLLFRLWLQTEAPGWLHRGYATHGQAVAAWIHDKPAAKAGLRILMDRAIAGASASWPASE